MRRRIDTKGKIISYNKTGDYNHIFSDNIEDWYGNLTRKKKKEQDYYKEVTTVKQKTKGRCKQIRPDLG